MKKLLLAFLLPFLSFGQCLDLEFCYYAPTNSNASGVIDPTFGANFATDSINLQEGDVFGIFQNVTPNTIAASGNTMESGYMCVGGVNTTLQQEGCSESYLQPMAWSNDMLDSSIPLIIWYAQSPTSNNGVVSTSSPSFISSDSDIIFGFVERINDQGEVEIYPTTINFQSGGIFGDSYFNNSNGSPLQFFQITSIIVDSEPTCFDSFVFGCTDPYACNYDTNAVGDDNSCIYPIVGCDFMGGTGCVYSCDEPGCYYYGNLYNVNDTLVLNDCESIICEESGDWAQEDGYDGQFIWTNIDTCIGCTNPDACNYDPNATEADGSCDYSCLCESDTVFIPVLDTIVVVEYVADTVEVIITEYIDCSTGMPCGTALEELLDKSTTNGKIYNLLGQEIYRKEGVYIENGQVKYRL